eukprot:CAMPEP_0196203680 /NCGR_PEP_ID=MMETSP0912-20130531/6077_1 /TAXON_ID=49265 /ORGANISM="Thalassiosira rotula, Strain GSO102" /LENGTH=54 /DNA_ID=CAMNT_0041477839 /DNA_START=90 /DNA_END=250 /DNA_ORIENTATION=-
MPSSTSSFLKWNVTSISSYQIPLSKSSMACQHFFECQALVVVGDDDDVDDDDLP